MLVVVVVVANVQYNCEVSIDKDIMTISVYYPTRLEVQRLNYLTSYQYQIMARQGNLGYLGKTLR